MRTRDAREASLWTSLFQAPGEARLTELDQDEFTWWGASSQSRLDRIYSSHTTEDQLDRLHTSAALAWPTGISDHRIVVYARTSPRALADSNS